MVNKKSEVIGDALLITLGVVLLVFLVFFNPISLIYSVFIAVVGLFFVAIGTVGLLVDI